MYSHGSQSDPEGAKEQRRALGRWIRSVREARGLKQSDVAARIGGLFNTYVSQVETGAKRISPECYQDWADALGLELREFAIEVLRYSDPVLHEILFGRTSDASQGGTVEVDGASGLLADRVVS